MRWLWSLQLLVASTRAFRVWMSCRLSEERRHLPPHFSSVSTSRTNASASTTMDFLPESMQAVLIRVQPAYGKRTKEKTIPACEPPADGTCLWHKLPQEIKDLIFEYAYISGRIVSPIHKSSWKPRTCDCDYRPGVSFRCDIADA